MIKPIPLPSLSIVLAVLLLAACDTPETVPDTPPAVEQTAFAILDEVLAQVLDSRRDASGPYQHSDPSIKRIGEKTLTPDAIADGVAALWCIGIGYEIAHNEGDDAGIWRAAELVVLVFEQEEGRFGGGEWVPQTAAANFAGLEEYNDLAYEECLGR